MKRVGLGIRETVRAEERKDFANLIFDMSLYDFVQVGLQKDYTEIVSDDVCKVMCVDGV
jgi:hypothetical protein